MLGGVGTAEIGSGDVVMESGFDGVFEGGGFFMPGEEIKEHAGGEDRAEGIGNSLPCDVRGGTVDRFEERSAAGMNVAGGCEAESTGELGGKVGDDVAEKIVGDDDIELAGIADEFHGEGIDVEMAGIDIGIFGANGFENTLPEIAGKGHGVGLVGHAEAFELVLAGVIKGEADNAFNAFAGVDVFLSGNFVGSVFLEKAAGANVDAFRVFAEDDKTNVVADAIFERGKVFMEKFGGAGVDKEIEFEAKAEKDVSSVLIGRNTRIPERAEEDGIEFIAEHFDSALRERNVLAEILIGGPIELDKFDGATAFRGGGLEGGDTHGSDFFADAVAGDDGDAGVGTAGTERSGGHGRVGNTGDKQWRVASGELR